MAQSNVITDADIVGIVPPVDPMVYDLAIFIMVVMAILSTLVFIGVIRLLIIFAFGSMRSNS